MKPDLYLLDLINTPIWEQLKIEEALLRVDDKNWCVINRGSPSSIVMGISGKPELLLNVPVIQQSNIPVWKRFSGGGTVVVDENTLFVSMICNCGEVCVAGVPNTIHGWAEDVYKDVFSRGDFALRENDYVFGDRKFGGNAQYLRKGRWLHHTSFLWDYDQEKMNCLLMPPKMPGYRENRSHGDFLCCLKDFGLSREGVIEALQMALSDRFAVSRVEAESVKDVLRIEHRKATRRIEI